MISVVGESISKVEGMMTTQNAGTHVAGPYNYGKADRNAAKNCARNLEVKKHFHQ
jgi:hypothetical protein